MSRSPAPRHSFTAASIWAGSVLWPSEGGEAKPPHRRGAGAPQFSRQSCTASIRRLGLAVRRQIGWCLNRARAVRSCSLRPVRADLFAPHCRAATVHNSRPRQPSLPLSHTPRPLGIFNRARPPVSLMHPANEACHTERLPRPALRGRPGGSWGEASPGLSPPAFPHNLLFYFILIFLGEKGEVNHRSPEKQNTCNPKPKNNEQEIPPLPLATLTTGCEEYSCSGGVNFRIFENLRSFGVRLGEVDVADTTSSRAVGSLTPPDTWAIREHVSWKTCPLARALGWGCGCFPSDTPGFTGGPLAVPCQSPPGRSPRRWPVIAAGILMHKE